LEFYKELLIVLGSALDSKIKCKYGNKRKEFQIQDQF